MRSIRSGWVVLSAACLLAAGPAPSASAGNCTGTGCAVLALDYDRCQARVAGGTGVRVEFSLDYSRTGGESGWEQFVYPGHPAPLKIRQGCITSNEVLHYSAFLLHPASQSSTDATTMFLGAPSGPRCSGDACQAVSLRIEGGCVWVSNRDARPVALTATAGGQPVALSLDGADRTKAGPDPDIVGSPNANADPDCADARRTRKMLQQLAAEGQQLPPTPELDATLAKCAREDQAAEAQGQPPPARDPHQAWAYDAFTRTRYPVYRTEIATATGCVARITDLESYTAAFR